MPRTPTIRYFESRSAYYTQFRGRQHLLAAGPKDEPEGPTYLRALEQFNRVMRAADLADASDDSQVSAVVVRYYQFLEDEGRLATLHVARTMLDPAVAEFGHLVVRQMRPSVVTDWLVKMRDPARYRGGGRERPWGQSTRNTACCALNRAFNWARKQGIVATNPIAGMEKPEKLVRGKEVLLPEELQDLLIATANPALATFLTVLRETGTRPGELIHAECEHYARSIPALVFPWNPQPGKYRWKNGRKTRRDRVIYLTPEVNEVIAAEVGARGGKGRIFLTRRGKAYNNNNLTNIVIKLSRHKKVREWCAANGFDSGKIMSYGFRHSYITRMLKAGCPIKLLADLCGTSVAMIEQTYSHAHDDHDAMRRLFLHFTAAASARSRPSPGGSTT